MHRKPGNSTPRAQTSSGARIISPQKVDLTSAKGGMRFGTSSSQNLEAGITQPVRVRTSDFNGNEVQKIRGLLNSESDQRLNTRDMDGNPRGLNGVLKNSTQGSRPSTSAEGYVTKSAVNTHRAGGKNDFKVRKMNSLYPTSRIAGGFMNGAVDDGMNEENMREDREAVEDLERWDNEYRVLAISKALEVDQKKVKESNSTQYNTNKLEPYKTPFLNREMINLIDADEGHEKEGRYMTTVSNLNKQQKTRVPQKSLETIMTEYNKKILNEILYARVSKQMKSKGQGGKLDLDHATKSVSSDTVNNFKNLQHTMQTNPRIIEYDELYQKLTIQKNLPKSEFDFDEDRKKLQAIENDHASIETKLKIQFEAVIDDIHKKKDNLNDLRMIIHSNNDEVKALEEEVEELQRRYTSMENQFNMQKEQNKAMFKQSSRKQRGAIKDPSARVHNNAYGDEYSKIQRQLDEKREQINDIKERIEDLHNETSKGLQKLSNLEREIKDLKFKKNQIRLQLKQLYVKILKNEETIFQHEASFITIIKNMWRINEEVLEDMFPAFLDKEALTFLIENARLEYELDQLDQLSKDEAVKEQQKHDQRNPDEIYAKFLKTQSTLNVPLSEQLVDVKKRLQNLKKGIVKMKRPVFIKDGTSRSRIIRWEELNLESDTFTEPHVEDQFIQEKINRAMLGIKSKIAELKEKEINRIFSNYINKEIDEKRLASLNKILISLFGKQSAEKIYGRFIRNKQTHDFKVSQNKTFVFSSTKHFSNSHVGDKNKSGYTLMLSYASNFRPKTSQATKEEEENRGRTKNFNKEINEYQEVDNCEVNYNYNLNYNYAPSAQGSDPNGQFYVSRSTILEPSSTKSKMFKSGNSFFGSGNKVSFKDSRPGTTGFVDMTQTQTTFNPNQGRSLLKSAQ